MDTDTTQKTPADTSQAGAQGSTRPDGSTSTFSGTAQDQPKNLNPPIAEAAKVAGAQTDPALRTEPLTTGGTVTERPDLAYDQRVATEEAAKLRADVDRTIRAHPLATGVLFNFKPAGGQGAAFRLEGMADGTIAMVMTPDNGLPMSLRLAGLDLAQFRRVIALGQPDVAGA